MRMATMYHERRWRRWWLRFKGLFVKPKPKAYLIDTEYVKFSYHKGRNDESKTQAESTKARSSSRS